MNRAVRLQSACLLVVLGAPVAHAEWPDSGLPLATGLAHQVLPAGITASGGDLYVFWAEAIASGTPLRAQRVTIEGTITAGWPDAGRVVVSSPAAVSRPEVSPDGAGGALIAWYDYGGTGKRGIYGTRVDAQGGLVPDWIPSGTPICTTFNAEGWGPLANLLDVCADGSGGAFVAWTDARNTPPMGTLIYDVYAQHVLADGTRDPSWPAEGLALSGGPGYKYPWALIADDVGGFWLVSENPPATNQLRVSHHAPDGSFIGTWITPSYASQPHAASDGAGGVLVTWQDCRNCLGGGSDGVYAMRLRAGALPRPGWAEDGVQVVATSNDEATPAIVSTGDGGAVVAWLTYGGGGHNWYAAQRIEANGVLKPAWPVGGRKFAISTSGLFGRPLIAPDGAGGAMFAFRRNTPNLFGSRVTAAGSVPSAFPDTGLSLCSLAGDQFLASMVSDGQNGAYVLWEDRRDEPPNGSDVYAIRFTRDGAVGSTPRDSIPPFAAPVTMSQPAPNPMSGSCTFRLSLAGATRVRVEVLDLTGRLVAVVLDAHAPAGTLDLAWDGHDRHGRVAPPGFYVVKARARGGESVRRIVRLE